MGQVPTTRTHPLCDQVMNVPISAGLREAVRDYARREGDSGMSAVVRKALCAYLACDMNGVPREAV
jgi:hypothetical protein